MSLGWAPTEVGEEHEFVAKPRAMARKRSSPCDTGPHEEPAVKRERATRQLASDSAVVKVKARSKDGKEVKLNFELGPEDTMAKVIRAWCRRYGADQDKVAFVHCGRLVSPTHWPADLGLAEGRRLAVTAVPRASQEAQAARAQAHAPQRPPSELCVFTSAHKPKLLAARPELRGDSSEAAAGLTGVLDDEWKGLTDEERQPYEQLADRRPWFRVSLSPPTPSSCDFHEIAYRSAAAAEATDDDHIFGSRFGGRRLAVAAVYQSKWRQLPSTVRPSTTSITEKAVYVHSFLSTLVGLDVVDIDLDGSVAQLRSSVPLATNTDARDVVFGLGSVILLDIGASLRAAGLSDGCDAERDREFDCDGDEASEPDQVFGEIDAVVRVHKPAQAAVEQQTLEAAVALMTVLGGEVAPPAHIAWIEAALPSLAQVARDFPVAFWSASMAARPDAGPASREEAASELPATAGAHLAGELQRRLDLARSQESALQRELGRPPASIDEMMTMEPVLAAPLSNQPDIIGVAFFEAEPSGQDRSGANDPAGPPTQE
ncbi:unnamed protein product [Prorocentrum cordatum]|uniref:HMG box domain-containing protein n=1 Tax=Prorocentrum cordatum TaxID=2364126 RepID=A0ABN9THL1_9DINO|nr:unnamed protein product [Polarella glacialis]